VVTKEVTNVICIKHKICEDENEFHVGDIYEAYVYDDAVMVVDYSGDVHNFYNTEWNEYFRLLRKENA